MPRIDELRAVAKYIERMVGAELPADIAAETYAPRPHGSSAARTRPDPTPASAANPPGPAGASTA